MLAPTHKSTWHPNPEHQTTNAHIKIKTPEKQPTKDFAAAMLLFYIKKPHSHKLHIFQ
jgi:hypothetical protein